jgi:hypothetical protein
LSFYNFGDYFFLFGLQFPFLYRKNFFLYFLVNKYYHNKHIYENTNDFVAARTAAIVSNSRPLIVCTAVAGLLLKAFYAFFLNFRKEKK